MVRLQLSYALLGLLTLFYLGSAQTCTTNASTFGTTVGDWSVHVLNDGNLRFPSNPFLVPVKIVLRAFKFYRPKADPYLFPQNVALLRRGKLVVLVDAGSGAVPSPFGVAGKLPDLLRDVGTSPEKITHVVLTHAHGDHLGGLLTLTGESVFPKATVVITREEYKFWSQPLAEIVAATPQMPAPAIEMMLNAFRVVLTAYSGRILRVDSRASLFPGFELHPTPGHTPGHISVTVSSRQQKLMILGDAILTRTSTIQHPDWNIYSDMNTTKAVSTRLSLLERLQRNHILVLSYHEAFPGLGYVVQRDAFFDWSPHAQLG